MIQTFPGSGSGEDNPHQRKVPTLAGHLKQNHPFAGADFYRCRVELEGSLSAPPAASSSKHGHSSVEWLWGSFLQAHARFCLFSHPNNSKETCSKVCILLLRKLNSSEKKKTKQLHQMTQNRSKADLAKKKQILGLLDSNLVILTSDSLVGVFVVPPPPTLPRAHYLHSGRTLLKYQKDLPWSCCNKSSLPNQPSLSCPGSSFLYSTYYLACSIFMCGLYGNSN